MFSRPWFYHSSGVKPMSTNLRLSDCFALRMTRRSSRSPSRRGRIKIRRAALAQEQELQQALERYRQLNAELDERVQARTKELAEREERLRELTIRLQRAR